MSDWVSRRAGLYYHQLLSLEHSARAAYYSATRLCALVNREDAGELQAIISGLEDVTRMATALRTRNAEERDE